MSRQGVEPFVDACGNDVPLHSPPHVYLGNLRRGRVCRVVGRPGKVKVTGQSPGSTAVTRSKSSRSFTTKDGKRVTIRSSHELTTLSRGTVVEVNR